MAFRCRVLLSYARRSPIYNFMCHFSVVPRCGRCQSRCHHVGAWPRPILVQSLGRKHTEFVPKEKRKWLQTGVSTSVYACACWYVTCMWYNWLGEPCINGALVATFFPSFSRPGSRSNRTRLICAARERGSEFVSVILEHHVCCLRFLLVYAMCNSRQRGQVRIYRLFKLASQLCSSQPLRRDQERCAAKVQNFADKKLVRN
jgi:hypothetical protein